MRHRLCFLSIILLIILQGLPADLSAQVWEPEEEKTAPAKPKKPVSQPRTKSSTQPAASAFADLIISTDLDVHVFVNGKKYTVLKKDRQKSVPLDEGDNFILVEPIDGGKDEFEEQVFAKQRGQNLFLKIDLGAKRQEELRLQEEEERLLGPIQEIVDNMVYVEGGSFNMGCTSEQSDCDTDEKPAHYVSVSGFYLSKYEVTNAEYCLFLNEEGNQEEEEGGVRWLEVESRYCKIRYTNGQYLPEEGYANHPVVEVSFYGAEAFCRWLSKKTGKTYRLPSESEWEYAARGGNRSGGYKYAGSNSLDEVGWYGDNSGKKPHKVGEKRANELGLYDMSGNVWEWCQDCWNGSYVGAPTNGSAWQSGDCGRRVLRGGSWDYFDDSCRVSYRLRNYPTVRVISLGFRLAQGR